MYRTFSFLSCVLAPSLSRFFCPCGPGPVHRDSIASLQGKVQVNIPKISTAGTCRRSPPCSFGTCPSPNIPSFVCWKKRRPRGDTPETGYAGLSWKRSGAGPQRRKAERRKRPGPSEVRAAASQSARSMVADHGWKCALPFRQRSYRASLCRTRLIVPQVPLFFR